MKQKQFQTLFVLALGLALLAVVLFVASAERKANAKNLSEQKTEAEDSAENKEITLTIKGEISGGEFIFEGNTIRFSNMMIYRMPEDITVDGKRWKDLTKPFKLL